MLVKCPMCHAIYDDAERWTICPHSPLGGPVDDLCPRCDTLKSVHGPCSHQIMGDVGDSATLPSVPKFPQEHTQAFKDREELEKLRQFKQFVHNRLDAAGVPADPNPEETAKTGCRIGARLDWLLEPVQATAGKTVQYQTPYFISQVEAMVRVLIDQKAMHTKKKVRIDEATWEQIIEHLFEEIEEFCEIPAEEILSTNERSKEELADIYGLLVHLVVKAGSNMKEIEELELKKLEQRYPQEDLPEDQQAMKQAIAKFNKEANEPGFIAKVRNQKPPAAEPRKGDQTEP